MCCPVSLGGRCKFYLVVVPEQSLKTVEEEKKAVYQIRRPLGLAFVISFCWLVVFVSVLYLDGL